MSGNEKDNTAKRVTVSYRLLSTDEAIRQTEQLRHALDVSPTVFVLGCPGRGKSWSHHVQDLLGAAEGMVGE